MNAATPLNIRPLAEADIGVLQSLDRRAHGHGWSRTTYAGELRSPDRLHLVGEVDGTVVGHAAAWHDGSTGRVTNLAVDERGRGAGYGARLLTALLRGMSAWQPLDELSLEVRAGNRTAQQLYRRFGFAPVGIRRGFYPSAHGAHGRDALVMTIANPSSNPTLARALSEPGEAA